MADPVHVAFQGTNGTGTTLLQVTLVGVTAGHSLIAAAGCTAAATPVFTWSDDKSNTWVEDDARNTTTRTCEIAHVVSAASGDTVISCTSDTSTGYFIGVSQVSFTGTCTLDDTSTTSNASTTTHNCAASGKIDASAESYILAVAASGTNHGGCTAATGFIELLESTGRYIQYKVSTAGETDNQCTFTSVNTINTGACVASFRGVTGGSGAGPIFRGRALGRGRILGGSAF